MLIERTANQAQLAAIYTAADILLNTTREDNYPTVNLEAEACGTPVWTYDTGGCAETLHLPESRVLQ
ncbi:MAG: glycosyltransferase [Paratractidigestivibacter faecalis]